MKIAQIHTICNVLEKYGDITIQSTIEDIFNNGRGLHRLLKSSGTSLMSHVAVASFIMLSIAVNKYKQTTILYCNMSTI